MNANLLIDAIVGQTMILVAQIATAAGTRAPLAHTANQVFADLVRELRSQGLGAKVIADMFGVSLRTYHNKVRRLSEGNTVHGQTLWEAVLTFIRQRGSVLRTEVLDRFSQDDDPLVRSVLRDLVSSGLVFQAGRGKERTYRDAAPYAVPLAQRDQEDPLVALVWVTVYRAGPVTGQDVAAAIGIDDQDDVDRALGLLVETDRIAACEIGGRRHYTAERCTIPVGAEEGWQAAVFDHYQAMVTAITSKLALGDAGAAAGQTIGGSTYSCDVWEGHPLRDEALGFLAACRKRGADLVRRVDEYNAQHGELPDNAVRVYAYVGQTVIPQREELDADG